MRPRARHGMAAVFPSCYLNRWIWDHRRIYGHGTLDMSWSQLFWVSHAAMNPCGCVFFSKSGRGFFPFLNKKGCLGDAGRFFSWYGCCKILVLIPSGEEPERSSPLQLITLFRSLGPWIFFIFFPIPLGIVCCASWRRCLFRLWDEGSENHGGRWSRQVFLMAWPETMDQWVKMEIYIS